MLVSEVASDSTLVMKCPLLTHKEYHGDGTLVSTRVTAH
jgi:hypothetical protein